MWSNVGHMARTPITLPFDPRRLREQRERRGLTQENLSQRTADAGHRVDRSTIAHLENGRRSPLAATLKRLADALDLTVDDLLVTAQKGRAS